jgi:hypothetical protein
MIEKAITGQKVWFVRMASDSIVSGKIIGEDVSTDGRKTYIIKPTFGKNITRRLNEFVWKTSEEARKFYAEWKALPVK